MIYRVILTLLLSSATLVAQSELSLLQASNGSNPSEYQRLFQERLHGEQDLIEKESKLNDIEPTENIFETIKLSSLEEFYNRENKNTEKTHPQIYSQSFDTEEEEIEYIEKLKEETALIEQLGYPQIPEKPTINQKEVLQYGYDLFNEYSFSEETFLNTIGPDYIIGPGDEFTVNIFGKIEESISAEVESSGDIYLPKIGQTPLAGLSYKEAQESIKKAYLKDFVNISVTVTLSKLRTIKVFILGNVTHPGSYNIPAQSSIFKALFHAKGPTKLGSMRSIKLIGDNKNTKQVDLYNYFLNPHHNEHLSLRNNDTIFVPAITTTAKVYGAVKRPAIYEIRSATNLYQLITYYGGGVLPSAHINLIKITRVSEQNAIETLDFNFKNMSDFKTKAQSITIRDGDSVFISEINQRKKDHITVYGAVSLPGDYELEDNMTVFDAIQKANGLLPQADSKIAIYRYNEGKLYDLEFISIDDSKTVPIYAWDSIYVQSFLEASLQKRVTISGAIKNPGEYILLESMKLNEIIELSKLTSSASLAEGEIFRISEDKEEIMTFNVKSILKNPNTSANILLKENDVVIIKEQKDLIEKRKVRITGEVHYPGFYFIQKNERLSDIIARAGGFTDQAFFEGARFTRKESKENEIKSERSILEREQKRIIYDQRRLSSLTKDNQDLYNQALFFLESKIEENTGRIIIDLKDLPSFTSSKDDIVVENGDTLHVPAKSDSILIVGGVLYPTSVLYTDNKSPDFYIKSAGGLTEFATTKITYVFKANGTIDMNPKTIDPGDTIYVPENIKTSKIEWYAKISQTFFNTITSVASLVYLISTIQ